MRTYTITNDKFQIIHTRLCEAFETNVPDVNFGLTTVHTISKNNYKGEHHPMYGRKHSLESREQMSESQKTTSKHATRGKKRPEFAKRQSGENNPMYGIPSPFTGKTHELLTCPHCNTIGGKNGMIQWHFDKCKFKR